MIELFSCTVRKFTNKNIASVFKRAVFGLLIVFGVSFFSAGVSQSETIVCYPDANNDEFIDEDNSSCTNSSALRNGWRIRWYHSNKFINDSGYTYEEETTSYVNYYHNGVKQYKRSIHSTCESFCEFNHSFADPEGGIHKLTQILTTNGEGSARFTASNSLSKVNSVTTDSWIIAVGTKVLPFTPVTIDVGVGELNATVNPRLPAGLIFNTSTGEITGTPSEVSTNTTYTVSVADSGDPAQTSSAKFDLKIDGKLPQNISFPPIVGMQYGDVPFVDLYSMGGDSGNAVTYVSHNTNVCTIFGSKDTGFSAAIVGAGECIITASQQGNDQYDPAEFEMQMFDVTQAMQSISLSGPDTVVYSVDGVIELQIKGGASSSPVMLTSSDTEICTVLKSTISMVKAGTCEIVANQAADRNYSAAKSVTKAIEITMGTRSMTVRASSESIFVGASAQLSSKGASGDLDAVYSITSGAEYCSLSRLTVTGLAEGSCEITAVASEESNYESASDTINITVSKASTSLLLSASNSNAKQGEVVTYTASLEVAGAEPDFQSKPMSMKPAPVSVSIIGTGTVEFYDGETSICSAVALNGSVATCDYAFKSAGDHNVSAVYSGDAAMKKAVSSGVNIAVEDMVENTQEQRENFVSNRLNHIANNQVSMIGKVTGTSNNGGGSAGELQMNANSEGYTVEFSTSRSKLLKGMAQNRVNSSFVGANDNGPLNSGLGFNQLATGENVGANDNVSALDELENAASVINPNNRAGTYDVWTQIFGSRTNAGDTQSAVWVGYAGAHYFVTNDALIGVLGQYDWSDQENQNANSKADGRGWMVGPYVAGKAEDQNLYYEARALWGRSSNNTSSVGTYTDTFDTTRWMASGALSGQFVSGEYTINPSAKISYFEETLEAYTDSLNNVIPEKTISMGEIRFGPSVKRNMKIEDKQVETMFGVSGVYNFGMSGAGASSSLGEDSLRARFDAGLSVVGLDGKTIQLSGYYDGVGVDDYSSYGGSLKLIVPIQ